MSDKKVMVVDDSFFMTEMISDILEQNGFSVVAKVNETENILDEYSRVLPDLVTMDITLDSETTLGGIAALKSIRELYPDAKVVMISALEQKDVLKEALTAGARDYITKPFNEEKVINTVRSILGQ